MALGRFGGTGKGEDVGALIAKKNYTRAIEVIREQLLTQRNDPRLLRELVCDRAEAGQIIERKGIPDIVEAIPSVVRALSRVRFLFAGEGKLSQFVLDRARELGVDDHGRADQEMSEVRQKQSQTIDLGRRRNPGSGSGSQPRCWRPPLRR